MHIVLGARVLPLVVFERLYRASVADMALTGKVCMSSLQLSRG